MLREKNLLLNKKGGKVGFNKVNFDSGFDKNNPEVVKENFWKKIRYR